ncbi:MAG: nucleotide exchange factor GrpE [Pelagibacterales bacterium]|nr:nucleotide exchange factor GrpE [Pelagibacterales bacterium]
MSEENRENKEKENMDKVVNKNKDLNDNPKVIKDNEQEEILSQESVEHDEENKKEEKTTQELEKELEETKDKMLRVLAESENTRKQIEKNRIDMAKYGVQPLARELVNVLDNFERALNSLNEAEEKKTLEGFKLIEKEIINILERFNVKKIEALGKPFDANLHQAMFEKPTEDFDVGAVCEIVQDGYMFHDRLLRPAMVGISKSEIKKEEEDKIEVESPKDDKEQR